MTYKELSAALRAMGQRPVGYYPIFRKLTGSVTSALLLAHLIYWALRNQGLVDRSDAELMSDLGMTKNELKAAKKRLKSEGFVTWKRDGFPARTLYEVHTITIAEALSKAAGTASSNNENAQLDEIQPTGNHSWVKSSQLDAQLAEIQPSSWMKSSQLHLSNNKEYIKEGSAPQLAEIQPTDELLAAIGPRAHRLWIEMQLDNHIAGRRRELLIEWLGHRHQIGKSVMSNFEMKTLLKFFNEREPARLARMIEYSLRGGYAQLYDDFDKKQSAKSNRNGTSERPDFEKYYPA